MKEKVLQLHEKLQNALPAFEDLLSLKIKDEAYLKLEPQQKRERIFEALRDLFVRASRHKPLVLAVEDLHWIDKTSEEFLDYLIGWLANARILLILLYRPEYTHLWGSKSYYTKIGVDQLSTPTSAELVQAILEGADVVPELRELILNRAGGNPLFMEEFTHSLLESGTIQKKDHQYVLSRKTSEIDIPDTIQGIISARIDRLEDNLKRTMQVASVIGRDFAFRILQTITGMKEELKSNLINLQGLEFIYEKQLFPELEYIFKHILTQEVAYNSLLTKRRKEIHENIGAAIETIYSDRMEEFYEMLGYHYSKSENLQKAAHYLKLSGIKAVGKHSPVEALHYYKEALKALKQMPESVENKKAQIEVCLLSYTPAVTLGYPDDSLQIIQEAEKLSKEIDDEKSLAHSYTMIGIFYMVRGEYFQATKYAEKGFETAKRTRDISVIAPLAMDLCYVYQCSGLYLKIIDIAPDVLHLLEENEKCSDFCLRAIAIYPSLCTLYGYALAVLGNFEKGEVFCEKGLHTATQIGESRTLVMSEFYSGWPYSLKGDGKLCVEHFKNCIKYGEEAKFYLMIGFAFGGLGYGHYLLGDFENAQKNIEKGLKIMQDTGMRFRLPLLYWLLSMPLFNLGEYEKALASIDEALILASKNNEKDIEGNSKIWLGRILGKTDPNQFDRAEESILKGINILEKLRLKPHSSQGYLYLGEFYTDIGQKEKAKENLKKAERMFQEMGMDYWLAKTQEVLNRL
jgi:tetratricopeptide (TPR) repeat protein